MSKRRTLNFRKRDTPDKRPRLFIGSSLESIDVTREIHTELEDDTDVTSWRQLFNPSDITIEKLLKSVDGFDFAAFVFSPDDLVTLRGQTFQTVRDNVVFELGLFMGVLGRERVFIVQPKDVDDFRQMTDIAGITPCRFNSSRDDADLASALVPACHKIRKTVRKHGIRSQKRNDESIIKLIAELGKIVLTLTSLAVNEQPPTTAALRKQPPKEKIKPAK